MESKVKKLSKGKNRMISGVCSGLADYVNMDPTIVRFLWIIVTAITGFVPGIIAYVIAAVIIPENVA